MSRGLRSRLAIGLLSIAGMATGHYLTYLIVAPHGHVRHELLDATGHAGESPFVILGLAALLGTCVAVLAGGHDRRSRAVVTAAKLFVLQLLAFVGLEFVERLAAGVDVAHAASEPVIWIGAVTQLVVAAVGAYVLRALRAAASVGVGSPPLPASISLLLSLGDAGVRPITRSRPAWEARGPPLSSLT